jgi:hypothetical protein
MELTGDHHVSEISQPQKDKYHIFTHMQNLNLKNNINDMIQL